MQGLLDDGNILINTNEDSYCSSGTCPPTVAGDIRIGEENDDPPLSNVEFDGKIKLFTECDLTQGDLTGNIDVVGCHNDDDPLVIELCAGNDNIDIVTTQCGGPQPTTYTGEGVCTKPSTCPSWP